MFRMLLKKWVFDLWDNLLGVVLLNIVFLVAVLALGLIPAPPVLEKTPLEFFYRAFLFLPALLFAGGANQLVCAFSQDRHVAFKEIPGYFAKGIKSTLVLGVLFLLLVFAAVVGMPYYFALSVFPFFLFGGLLFWVVFLFTLILQYYWPLNALFQDGPVKLLQKGLKILVENGALTLFFAIVSILLGALTLMTWGIFPGVAGILLWNHTGLRLILLKYEYRDQLIAQGKTIPKKTPWKEVLKEEHERIGKRGIKDFLFPGKS